MHHYALSEGKTSHYFIKYRPSLVQHYGCRHTSLIIDQLEFWFAKKNFKDGFFKFIAPCHHHFYKKNDSWTELLGISRSTFIRCFGQIAVRYASKTRYEAAQDKFQGFPYASYYDHHTYQMHFIKNYDYDPIQFDLTTKQAVASDLNDTQAVHQKVDNKVLQQSSGCSTPTTTPQICGTVYQGNFAEDQNSYIFDPAFDVSDSVVEQEVRIKEIDLNCSQADDSTPEQPLQPSFDQSFDTHMCDDDRSLNLSTVCSQVQQNDKYGTCQNDKYQGGLKGIYIYNKYINTNHRKLSFFKEKKSVDNFILEKTLGQQMIAIWHHTVHDPYLKFTCDSLLVKLNTVLEDHFESSLYHWQQYCKTIASSKFLMGEGRSENFKQGVYLLWAIKAENISKVQHNQITLGDRVLTLTPYQQQLSTKRHHINQEIKELQYHLSRDAYDIKIAVSRLRRVPVDDQVQAIINDTNTQQCKDYQQQFEDMLKQGDLDDGEWFYRNFARRFDPQQWYKLGKEGGSICNIWFYFEYYLTQRLADAHFGQSEQEMIEHRVQEMTAQLNQAQQQLAEVNFKMGLN